MSFDVDMAEFVELQKENTRLRAALGEIARAVEAEYPAFRVKCGRGAINPETWDGAINEHDDIFRAKNIIRSRSLAVEDALKAAHRLLTTSGESDDPGPVEFDSFKERS